MVKEIFFFQENKIVILTKEEPGIRTFPDLADGQEVSFVENYDRLKKYPDITLIRNEELDGWGKLEKETGIAFENVPFTDKKVFDAFLNGDTQGISEFRTDFAGTVMSESAPATIHELIQIPGMCHGTGVWEKMKVGNSYGTGFAGHVTENVRRGAYAQNGMPEIIRQQLLELGVEEWFIESIEKCRLKNKQLSCIIYLEVIGIESPIALSK